MEQVNVIDIITILVMVTPIIIAVFRYFKDIKRKAQQDTLETYQQLQKDVLSKISRLTPSQMHEFSNNNKSEEYKQVTEYLMTIECFCIGLRKEIYDFDVFFALTHDYFNNKRGPIKPTIEPMLDNKLKRNGKNYYPSLKRIWERMDATE